AVVVARHGGQAHADGSGDTRAQAGSASLAASARLVAYVTAREPGQAIDTARLRQALLATLPDYMVPQAIDVMAALPLNANGKVDRQVLQSDRTDRSDLADRMGGVAAEAPGSARPQGEIEQALAAIWAEVLALPPERIGRHDNFFEVGGHSLLVL